MFTREQVKKAGKDKQIKTLADDLISSGKELAGVIKLSLGEVQDVDINKLEPYPEHTYEGYDEERMKELEKSIKEYGLQTPIILWDNGGDKYIILAGHNRVKAHKNLGYTKIPAIIKKNITKEEAAIIVNQTNMVQRAFENLSIYEKASSIAQMKQARDEWIKKHPEFENEENDKNKESKNGIRSIAREFGISKSSISTYLTLYDNFKKEYFTYMEDTKDRKKLFDTNVGIILCKINKKNLKVIFDFLKELPMKINKQQAKELVDIYIKNNEVTEKDLNKVLVHSIIKTKKPITFKREVFRDYFSDSATDEEIMNEILEMLKERKG